MNVIFFAKMVLWGMLFITKWVMWNKIFIITRVLWIVIYYKKGTGFSLGTAPKSCI